MAKSRKRGHRNRGGRPRIYPPKLVIPREENEAKFAAFREGIQAGNSAAELSKRLQISKDTSTNWLGHVKAQALMALDAFGLNELAVAQDLAYCRRSPSYKMRLEVAKEVAKMRGMYPKQAPEDPDAGLTVVVRDVVQIGDLNAAREAFIRSGSTGEHRRD